MIEEREVKHHKSIGLQLSDNCWKTLVSTMFCTVVRLGVHEQITMHNWHSSEATYKNADYAHGGLPSSVFLPPFLDPLLLQMAASAVHASLIDNLNKILSQLQSSHLRNLWSRSIIYLLYCNGLIKLHQLTDIPFRLSQLQILNAAIISCQKIQCLTPCASYSGVSKMLYNNVSWYERFIEMKMLVSQCLCLKRWRSGRWKTWNMLCWSCKGYM